MATDPSPVGVLAGAGGWDHQGFVNEGRSFSRRFGKPGTYSCICVPHEGMGMTGTVVR